MDALLGAWEFVWDPGNWSGSSGLAARLWQHVVMTVAAVTSAAVVALPPGLWIGHRRRGGLLAVTVVNIGRAVPAFGILALVFIATERLGFLPAYLTLVILSLVPLFVTAVVGVEGVDADVVDAARGMGFSEAQVLRRVELPLAAPLIFTGVRLALVDVVATATLAALVAWGGLGRLIIDGLAQRDQGQVVVGAVAVAVVAVAADRVGLAVQRAVAVGSPEDKSHRPSRVSPTGATPTP